MSEQHTTKGDRFVSPCPPPTAHQREVAEVLIEECAEVTQRATKLLRFGVEEVQPGQPHSNAYRLGLEVGDLLESVDMATRAGLIPPEAVEAGRASKRRQLARFMQTTAALLALAFLAFPADAQDRTETRFQDRSGHYQGRSVTQSAGSDRTETRFYDRSGRYQGRAVTRNGETRYYDRQGRLQGKARER